MTKREEFNASSAEPYDSTENSRRLKAGLHAVLSGHMVEFAKKTSDLIVVFDDPFTKYDGGRITMFQAFVADRVGVVPEILKEIPGCVKVFFSLGEYSKENLRILREVLIAKDSQDLFRELRISQIQTGSEMLFVNLTRHPSGSPPRPA